MSALGRVPFTTIPILPALYLILAPIATRSLISSLMYISTGVIFLWQQSRGSGVNAHQTEVHSRELSNHAKRYRNGKEIPRAEKRILEDNIIAAIPDDEERLRWYRERARALEMELGDEGLEGDD